MATQTGDQRHDSEVEESIEMTGFFTPDASTKLVVGTIALISVTIYAPMLYDAELEVLNVPWLLLSAGVGQSILLVVTLVGMYVLVGE